MRHVSRPIFPAACALAACVLLTIPGGSLRAAAPKGLPPYNIRLTALDDAKTRASLPFTVDTAGPECLPGVPLIVGPDFDPASVAEIATSQAGTVVAWTTIISEAGVPGGTRDIVIYRQTDAFTKRDRVSDAAGDNDQPSLSSDRFGFRMAWRGSAGARETTVGNIHLRSHRRKDPPAPTGGTGAETGGEATTPGTDTGPPFEDVKTVQVTKLSLEASTDPDVSVGTAYDPSLTSRVRLRDAGSGITVRERDARIAFVSTARLDKSVAKMFDPDTELEVTFPQLFVWHELADRFQQITRITAADFEVNRPSITESGGRIAFECTADLTPNAVDPKDPSRVGNAAHVRQIYLWNEGRGFRQLTWSDRACFSPRFARGGRELVFCSSGELISGGNPERNFEIFGWSDTGDAARALRQLTRTAQGHSVLPRPASGTSEFAFWSTASVPTKTTAFGGAGANCGPIAYSYRRRVITRVGGLTDSENLGKTGREPRNPDPATPVANPVACGPPCPGRNGASTLFATNHPDLNVRNADDDLDGVSGAVKDAQGKPIDDRKDDVSLLIFHIARATPK